MYDSDSVRRRCRVIYDGQVARHRKKLQRSAGRNVKLEIPANQVLPYSFQEFFDWVWHRYGVKPFPCPWCGAMIDFISMQIDHRLPLNHGGSIGLDNQEAVCEGCNTLKGSQSPDEFEALLRFLSALSPSHRKYLEQRIRAGAAANRMRFFPHKKKDGEGAGPPKASARQSRLDLDLHGPF